MSAIFGGVAFRINPESIQGGLRAKVNAVPTQGGRVVQVFGTEWTDITLTGSFGRGGFQEQNNFLLRMVLMAAEQEQRYATAGATTSFLWPERGWNFNVMLRDYSSPDGPDAVSASPDIINYRWTLTLFVVEDNGGLKQAVAGEDAFIQRLSNGLGWKQSTYNGPLDPLGDNAAANVPLDPNAPFPGASPLLGAPPPGSGMASPTERTGGPMRIE